MNYKWIVNIGVLVLIATEIFAQNTRKFSLETTDSLPEVYAPTGNIPELVLQEGHRGSIAFLQYSGDGKLLYSCADEEMKIWDANSGKLIKTIAMDFYHDPIGIIDPPILSPDGKFLIYISDQENKLKCYDIFSGEEKSINAADSFFHSSGLAFSHNGNYFAVAKGDEVRLYSSKTFKNEVTLRKNNSKCSYSKIVFGIDDSYVAVIDNGTASIDLWNITQRAIVDSIKHFSEQKMFWNVVISNDNKFIIADTINNIYVYDRFLKRNVYVFKPSAAVHDIECTNDGLLFAVGYNMDPPPWHNNFVTVWSLKTGKEIVYPSLVNIDDVDCIAFSPKTEEFALGMYRKLEIHSKNSGELTKTIIASELSSSRYLPNLNQFYFGCGSSFYLFDNLLQKNYFSTSNHIFDSYKQCQVCDTGIFTVKDNALAYFDFITKKNLGEVFKVKEKFNFVGNKKSDVILYSVESSPTKVFLYDMQKKTNRNVFNVPGRNYKGSLAISPNGKFALISNEKSTEVFDTVTGKKVMTLPSYNVRNYSFSLDDRYCISEEVGKPIIYDTLTWKTIISEKGLKGFLSSTGQYFAIETYKDGNLKIFDRKTNVLVSTIENRGRFISEVSFFDDESKIIILDNAGILRCYDVQTGRFLVAFAADSSGDWITYTPEGYFTGSPGGINKFVHLVDGMQVFELGQMYDTLYRPDLVQAKLEGKDIGKPVLKDIVATGDAPFVQFNQTPMATSRQIKLEFSVQDTGGGIGYVYLSQNGKAMQVSSGEKSKAGQRFIYTCDVTLAKGENVFEAYAANSANKIESRHVSSTLSWQGKVEDSNLYVLAIGVDKYIKMPQNNLKYSVADATGIIESFKASPGGLYGSVNVMTLLDSDVSKDNIQKAFETFASKVKPDDMFVLHLAGHGVNYGGEYYYLPSDTLAKSDSDYPKVGVSKHFLTESLSEIQSLNTIILLDTCYSGAFIDAKAQGNELAQKTALEHLAHTSGQVILTASANSQTAAEGYKGHGIFTYAIMEAISGKANYNADSTLSIKEITQYVGYEVPNIYEKMGLARQSPWNSPLRGDFSVVATGNRQSPQFHEVSLDGGKRTDWVTVRTDDSDVGNFENALASAKKEAKKTQKSAKTEKTKVSSSGNQRTRRGDVIGISIDLGKATGPFYSGFDYDTQLYLFGGKHVFGGIDADMIFAGLDGDYKSMSETKSLYFLDFNFLLGCSFNFWKFRPYVMGGAGYYFSVVSNSQDSAPSGFTWDVRLGLDLAFKHFFVGGQYKLKNFTDSGYVDVWTISIGGSF